MIVYLANMISVERMYSREDYRFWAAPTGVFAVIALFVGVLGSDAGTTIIMAFILYGMYFIAGLPRKYLTWITILGVVAMPLLMMSNASRRGRVMAWLFPRHQTQTVTTGSLSTPNGRLLPEARSVLG